MGIQSEFHKPPINPFSFKLGPAKFNFMLSSQSVQSAGSVRGLGQLFKEQSQTALLFLEGLEIKVPSPLHPL